MEVYDSDSRSWVPLTDDVLYRVACGVYLFHRTVMATAKAGEFVSDVQPAPFTVRDVFLDELSNPVGTATTSCLPPPELHQVDFQATNLLTQIQLALAAQAESAVI